MCRILDESSSIKTNTFNVKLVFIKAVRCRSVATPRTGRREEPDPITSSELAVKTPSYRVLFRLGYTFTRKWPQRVKSTYKTRTTGVLLGIVLTMTLPVLKGSECLIGRMRRSELSDQVNKMNRQEEKMLQRRLRVLRKQERVAEHLMDRDIHDAERLRRFIDDKNGRAIDLNQYDTRKSTHKSDNYAYGVKFPPLTTGNSYMTSTPRPGVSVALSRRALRQNVGDSLNHPKGSSVDDREPGQPIIVHLRDIRYG
ncbi:hypothetical protein CAPTEDRAFT_189752 [Capitella teleta]|uniref:Uncharacterized protein n=1 Tax=Capitella teleta TaxID=283909 RepID=R7U1M7_CAPTE|nr:hypothetical protein CAPTEDRAFT_189752 [Capitella teleta]|eukprot:ELU00129.1 hypothetical protein CAPTEDRAFT_189752 [Capitella teleta]